MPIEKLLRRQRRIVALLSAVAILSVAGAVLGAKNYFDRQSDLAAQQHRTQAEVFSQCQAGQIARPALARLPLVVADVYARDLGVSTDQRRAIAYEALAAVNPIFREAGVVAFRDCNGDHRLSAADFKGGKRPGPILDPVTGLPSRK